MYPTKQNHTNDISDMKKIYALLFLFLTTYSSSGQKNIFTSLSDFEKRGDKLFYYFSYTAAVLDYQQALKTDPEKDHLKLKIAECYRLLNDPLQAETWYAKAMANDQVIKPEHKMYYAQALSSNGKYVEAKKWLEAYQLDVARDSRTKKNIEAINNLGDLLKDSLSFIVTPLAINSPQADFSPSFYENGIVFISARAQSKIIKPVFSWNESQFLDLYYSEDSENGTNNTPRLFHQNINTGLHEGPTVFYDKGRKMIFTRNNLFNGKEMKSKEGIIKLKLFSSEMNGEGWAKPKSLPFNSDEYSVGHPAITENGKTLFFVSDMPGGFGGTDVYRCEWVGDNWGKPVNLGPEINTEGNEMFPFIHQDNKLYFSSNGHGGLGGLDIFQTDLKTIKVSNIGSPINSQSDDFGLIIYPDEQSGYFSSNRKGSAGDDDIYHFAVVRKMIDVIAYDFETGVLMPDTEVKIIDAETVRNKSLTNFKGTTSLSVDPRKNYTVNLTKEDYVPAEGKLESIHLLQKGFNQIRVPMMRSTSSNPVAERDSLKVIIKIPADGNGVRAVTGNPADNQMKITNLHPVSVYQIRNGSGTVQEVALINRKAYLLSPDARTLKGQSGETIVQFIDKLSAQSDARNNSIREAFRKIGYEPTFIEIKNIYYDYDKYYIRNDASSDLDRLVQILLDYTNLQVELSSHTDSRGSNLYNNELAKRRAIAAKEYLINEGVEAGRIELSDFGELQLINGCGDSKVCDEDDHQLNRRTEIALKFITSIELVKAEK